MISHGHSLWIVTFSVHCGEFSGEIKIVARSVTQEDDYVLWVDGIRMEIDCRIEEICEKGLVPDVDL